MVNNASQKNSIRKLSTLHFSEIARQQEAEAQREAEESAASEAEHTESEQPAEQSAAEDTADEEGTLHEDEPLVEEPQSPIDDRAEEATKTETEGDLTEEED